MSAFMYSGDLGVLNVSDFAQQREFDWPYQEGNLYTILLLDNDTKFLHWLITNVRGKDLHTGNVILQYLPITMNSYIMRSCSFIVLEQIGQVAAGNVSRQKFSLDDFVEKHSLFPFEVIKFKVTS